jgi:signal transduction histidine kinase/ligand-binding sensor domain-containing protein/CheY-like chemotaxis protein
MKMRVVPDQRRLLRGSRIALGTLRLGVVGSLCAVVTLAQYLPFRFGHIGTDQGLSNQLVTCVLRDQTGYLWVGTENGLNRYDGYRFEHFLSVPDDPASLRDSAISTLFEDRAGHLWVGTKAGGLHLFDGRTEKFAAFDADSAGRPRVSNNRIYRVFEDAAGSIWIGTAGGLDKLTWDGSDTSSVQIASFRNDPADPESLSHNRVTSIAQDSAGTVWVGTRAGLNRLVSESPARFARYLYDAASPTGLPDDEVYSLLVDSADVLWIGTWGGGGLARLSAVERQKPAPAFERLGFDAAAGTGIPVDIVVDILEDHSGNLWFCTGDHGRLVRLAAADRTIARPRFQDFGNDEGNAYSLSGGSPLDVCVDNQGILWVANLDGGLEKLDTTESCFIVHRRHPTRPGLPSDVATSLAKDRDGALWVGTDAGLSQVVPATVQYEQPRHTLYAGDAKAAGSLRSSGVASLLADSRGRLWVGTVNGGLSVREPRPGRAVFRTFTRDPADPQSLGSDSVLELLEDSRGRIWVGTYHGLYRMVEPELPGGRATFVSYFHGDDPATLSSDQIESLAEGPGGSIWVGTSLGLNRLDPDSGEVVRFMADRTNPASLSDPFVSDLRFGPDGRLWIGTKGGLCSLDVSTNAIARADAATGLERVGVSSLVFDDHGIMWAGTINGLVRVDPATGQSVTFGKGDGLPSEVFNRGAAIRDADGRLYFGGTGGIFEFDPATVPLGAAPPPVVLTRLLLANRVVAIGPDSVLPSQLQSLETLELSHSDNLFAIEFAALDLTRSEAIRYAYRLDGLYDEWIETDSENRRATFTNLPDGDYTFRVRAANRLGEWGEAAHALRIVVNPPWWRTWWAQLGFYSLAVLALLAIPFLRLAAAGRQRKLLEGVVRERTTELRKTNEQLTEASRAKSLFLSNMSHELRTPLNAVIGFAQLMDRDPALNAGQKESLGLIQRAGEHLLELINDVLSISKIEAGKLVLVDQVFDPRRMLQSVEEIARVRAEAKELHLSFESSGQVPRAVRGDEGKLRQVLINLLGNAVKFTDRGRVTLRCEWKDDDRARFEVEDTGVGMTEAEVGTLFEAFVQTESGKSAKEGTGLGLVISRQIVRLMGGDITVRSTKGEGTVFAFEVALPQTTEAEVRRERRKVMGLEAGQAAPRILVVDDSRENRLLLGRLLESIGMVVTEASNGQEAVDRWESWRPDLIFMDLRMHGMDGYEATREIRRREAEAGASARPSCPIVALTASAFEHERGTILEQGANDFVTKPFREDTIFEKVGEFLGVRYRYEEAAPVKEPVTESDDAELAGRLAALPVELVRELYDAMAGGDRKAATRVAERIAETDERLAGVVQARVRAYELDELLTVIESLGVL